MSQLATTYQYVFADVPSNVNSLCRLSSNLEMRQRERREKMKRNEHKLEIFLQYYYVLCLTEWTESKNNNELNGYVQLSVGTER